MMELPPILTTCSHGNRRIGRPPATGRVSEPSSRVCRASAEATCLMLFVFLDMYASLFRGDDGTDVLTGKRAGQIAGNEPVDDLHLTDMARLGQQIQHRK